MDFWENKNAYLKMLGKILTDKEENHLIRLKALRIIDRVLSDNSSLFDEDEENNDGENDDWS